jgi:4-azaleucine resistance transporter AzlC
VSPSPSARAELAAGVRAFLPLAFGVVPFGLIFGASAVKLGLSAATAQVMSLVIFAGSAQFIAAPLVVGAAGLSTVLVVGVVNLRHALYSASLAPHLKGLHPLWKALLAYLLTDEAYALAIAHYSAPGDDGNRHWYFLGAALALWSSWQASTAAGAAIGAQVPSGWSLDFALPLTFIALGVPMLRSRAVVSAALVGGAMGVAVSAAPYGLGLTLATLLGIAAGMAVER